jgi:hypothetical protein
MNIKSDSYKEMMEQFDYNDYEFTIAISTCYFSFILAAIFGKLGDKFTSMIFSFITIFSFFYCLYTIYKCIRLFCRRRAYFS